MTEQQLMVRSETRFDAAVELNARLEAMIQEVPDAGDDAVLRMVEQLFTAQSIEDLDKPWSTQGLARYLDQVVHVQSIEKMPSDFPDGSPYFFVCHGVLRATGEEATLTTSAVMVMVQLIIAHARDMLPMDVVPRQATRPTKSGYYPQHLEVYREGRTILDQRETPRQAPRPSAPRPVERPTRADARPAPAPKTADADEKPGF